MLYQLRKVLRVLPLANPPGASPATIPIPVPITWCVSHLAPDKSCSSKQVAHRVPRAIRAIFQRVFTVVIVWNALILPNH